MGDQARRSHAKSGIFGALKSPVPEHDAEGRRSLTRVNSSRTTEALQLREALQKSSSRMNRKLLINELSSPRRGANQNQFADTDELDDLEDDEDFAVASFRGKSLLESLELNVRSAKSSGRHSMFARMDTQSPTSKKSEQSVSSKVFKDRVAARFKSTTKSARKVSSADSTEENWEQ
ncbi:unnamed protein product [Chondrus crispus]|uniref:Uncharacterized protein n=1 Tax=Chondrus crispus TaxID=2769 RepID=R7QEY3_CHOCR|nr:unnamed protein product [Chondrus crispus]CDF37072.1 unnamed protein product [Chondrus crispus]|eukprot:XP_005716891.1 unnamed protein product [Chondrus crispus]